jgi:hypothetical protein
VTVDEHRIEYRRKVAGRGVDGLQHLGGRGLLLQRLGEVVGTLGEVGRALAQLIQQSRIFNGDDGLAGKARDQRDLFLGEGTNFLAIQGERTD